MASSNFYKHSYIGRPVDPRYRTNLIVSILAPLSAVIAFVLAVFLWDRGIGDSLLAAFFTLMTTFITWAIARELDPDHDWSAFVGVAIALVAMFVYRAPAVALIALGVMNLLLRVVNRTVGPPIKMGDSVVVLLGIIVVAFTPNWVVAFIGVAAFLLDALMSNPNRRHLAFAGVGLIVAILRVVIQDFPETGGLSGINILMIAVISIAFFMTILATRKVTAPCDLEGHTLDVKRVRGAMMLGLVGTLIVALWSGDTGFVWMLPLWSAMLGIALYRLPVTFREWRDYQEKKAKAA